MSVAPQPLRTFLTRLSAIRAHSGSGCIPIQSEVLLEDRDGVANRSARAPGPEASRRDPGSVASFRRRREYCVTDVNVPLSLVVLRGLQSCKGWWTADSHSP